MTDNTVREFVDAHMPSPVPDWRDTAEAIVKAMPDEDLAEYLVQAVQVIMWEINDRRLGEAMHSAFGRTGEPLPTTPFWPIKAKALHAVPSNARRLRQPGGAE